MEDAPPVMSNIKINGKVSEKVTVQRGGKIKITAYIKEDKSFKRVSLKLGPSEGEVYPTIHKAITITPGLSAGNELKKYEIIVDTNEIKSHRYNTNMKVVLSVVDGSDQISEVESIGSLFF